MHKKIRNVVAVIVGIIAAAAIFFAGEQLNWMIHPYSEGLDMDDREKLREHFKSNASSIWFVALFIWALGSTVSGYLIKRICKTNNYRLPLITGCILTLIGTINLFTLPHPVWFSIVAFFCFLPFVLLGFLLIKVEEKKRKR